MVNGISAMHVDISYFSQSVYMEIIWQGRFSSRHGKAGQFLSHKHSVQLCGDDIMLTLQIKSQVKSSLEENILMYTRDEKRPVSANIPCRVPYKQFLKQE